MQPQNFTIFGHSDLLENDLRCLSTTHTDHSNRRCYGVAHQIRTGGSKTPETWLSLTGTMAQFTAEYSVELKVPSIHAWVSNGAWGGRVIRYVPGHSGCYECLSKNAYQEVPSAPLGEVYPRGCGFPTFTGASYDIYEVATHTVRMAINTLLNPEHRTDHLVIEHYPTSQVKSFAIQRDLKCRICGDNHGV